MQNSCVKEPDLIHRFRNHLAVVISFSELLLLELHDEAHRSDVLEIHRAASAAMALLPQCVASRSTVPEVES
jgi:hypothetical protein